MKKIRVSLIASLLFVLICISSVSVFAATKNIPSCDFVQNLSALKKKGCLKLGGGSVDVKVPAIGGYMKYTAPKTGTYEFIFENVKGINEEELGSISFFQGSNLTMASVSTLGKSTYFLDLRTENFEPDKDYLLSRYAKKKLTKGKTIYIRAKFTGKVSMRVTVLKPGVERKCKIDKSKVTLKPGERTVVRVLGAGSKKVNWKSNNTSVVSITKDGVLTAKKVGTAKVSTMVNMIKYVCTVTVTTNSTPTPTPRPTIIPTPTPTPRLTTWDYYQLLKNALIKRGRATSDGGYGFGNVFSSGGVTYTTAVIYTPTTDLFSFLWTTDETDLTQAIRMDINKTNVNLGTATAKYYYFNNEYVNTGYLAEAVIKFSTYNGSNSSFVVKEAYGLDLVPEYNMIKVATSNFQFAWLMWEQTMYDEANISFRDLGFVKYTQ